MSLRGEDRIEGHLHGPSVPELQAANRRLQDEIAQYERCIVRMQLENIELRDTIKRLQQK